MSYLIHEHSRYTSAIDKYWIFESKQKALIFLKQMLTRSLHDLDIDWYKEVHDSDDCEKFNIEVVKDDLINSDDPQTFYFTEGDYLVFSNIYKGFGRRP